MAEMQVINHGISEQAMQDMAEVGEEFFRLPAADKVEFCSEDITKVSEDFSSRVAECTRIILSVG